MKVQPGFQAPIGTKEMIQIENDRQRVVWVVGSKLLAFICFYFNSPLPGEITIVESFVCIRESFSRLNIRVLCNTHTHTLMQINIGK